MRGLCFSLKRRQINQNPDSTSKRSLWSEQTHGGKNSLGKDKCLFNCLCLDEKLICTKPQWTRDMLINDAAEASCFWAFNVFCVPEATKRMPASLIEASYTCQHSIEGPSLLKGQEVASYYSVTLAPRLAHSRCSKNMLLGLT